MTPMTQHGFGPELGRKPTTYTCWCGFRNIDYAAVGRHITAERERAHMPRRLTTIPAANVSPPAGLEVASTPHGDEHDAVEIRVAFRKSDGAYQHHTVLVRRDSIPFLIEELEVHRLDKNAEHTCPEPPQPREPEIP